MSNEDLLKRLRAVEIDDDHDLWTNSHLFAEAADAIERLAADNAILSKWHIDAEARAEAAERKVEKLREAIGDVLRVAQPWSSAIPVVLDRALDRLDAALAETEKGDE